MEAKIKGWNELYIRNIPFGCILNKNSDYPLILCNTWISEDGKWMLEKTGYEFRIKPKTEESQRDFFTKTSYIGGCLDHCLSELNRLFYEE